MASLVLSGDTSGSITVSAPAVAGSNTQTLVATTGTLAPIVSGTSVTASGTSVDFTGIPSWVKRITVMFNGVSTNGTSNIQIQIGSGSVTTSGYATTVARNTDGASPNVANPTAGFNVISSTAAANLYSGFATLVLISGNTWVEQSIIGATNAFAECFSSGSIALSGALDRLRITTVNGTNTFDAGTINILYE